LLFNSFIFIFAFLPLTVIIYFYLNNKRLTYASKAFLVFVSLFFYSWWNIAYLPIILVSMLFNYVIGLNLSDNNVHQKLNKKLVLSIGIVANISLLGYFKYADFLIENINMISNGKIPLLHLALPLAISFFTFQQIAYLVDSYRGETKEYDFLNYANFVTFFPQLIAGPIVHHSEMMPQFSKRKNKVKNYNNIALGLFIFSIGLFKKVAIADSFSIWATAGFDLSTTLNFYEAWATSLSYTFQLYFDFSGYTDMAIGSALLFNIKLPINFDSPYKATNIQDFWRRWHITLSRFLRDYIYIPLGGNRKGRLRTYGNLMITFIIGGIWHGAGWTFIFWGFLHGLALVIQRVWIKLGYTMNKVLAWFITFNFLNVAWVFFRAQEWEDAIKILTSMLALDNLTSINHAYFAKIFNNVSSISHYIHSKFIIIDNPSLISLNVAEFIFFGFITTLVFKNSNELANQFNQFSKVPIKWFLFSIIILGISLMNISEQMGSEFLYFNF
jgi:D-alanyl-lipoteichoic acid acyltransferase DltB (MBOAT superfamily)